MTALIGLTTYMEQTVMGLWDRPAAVLPRVYTDCVIAAGGAVVGLPPQPPHPDAVERVLEGIDGLILTGGKDVDAALYGERAHPENDAPRPDRDAWEIALVHAAIARDLPVLGICRGLQVLNVALGGTLVQHLPDVIGSTRYSYGNATFADNPVLTEPGTRIGGMLGASLTVKSYHHQAINHLAPGLTVSARGDDGIIQAVDIDALSFGVAVQWHPEESPDDLRLFTALVEAAQR
ncbi:gamma-glutamyl-gamma-aminobutyrate hydrolase family protein [Microcella humidisoli]|uniref:Gamma-glutamyl-gamma-aminobutyrate hydrolase family protein n=1 Tax=Microcella humidisoli TaxID=2963406 RepID=A0ABY5FU29_9MICO|nr:gamma-glutamyl-gamma-aminobutyrate hydrolase family protein [Microcella humidisoli]UTT61753.1 gamma-glutamyl-gamma-aminobutyrate hydrolase family protein [Microcella humidisoli]